MKLIANISLTKSESRSMCELSRQDRAEQLFKSGFNCAQSVFAAFSDKYGIDEETALKISASFGAGFGRMREVCGCFSAIAMIAGLETGSAVPFDAQGKQHNYEIVQKLAEEYKKVSGGSIVCRELLGIAGGYRADNAVKPSERTEEYYKKRPCVLLVRNACTIIENEFFGGMDNE